MSQRTWIDKEGTWENQDGKVFPTLTDSEIPTAYTKRYTDTGLSDFILETSFKITQGVESAEAKIIFSEADKGERYRIDFMSGSSNMCRISTGGAITYAQPLTIERDVEYKVRVLVKGNYISIFVNDMLIWPTIQWGNSSDGKIGIGMYHAKVEFSDPLIKPLEIRNCFIVMPFNEKRNLVYDYAIEPSLKSHPDYVFNCERADKILTSDRITAEIDERIRKAHVILADITENNRNVFYELGLAHANKRKVVLLMQKQDDGTALNIPFDLQDFRTHLYDFSKRGFEELRPKLASIVSEVLKGSASE